MITNKPEVVLPEQDLRKTQNEQGLFRKYEVRRTDGSDFPGGKHDGCEYFVLDMTHDPHAKAAAAAYADSAEMDYPDLAADMRGRYGLDTLTRPADGDFVMVPKEPTGDMLDAMIAPWLRGAGTERECLTAGWKGALSAAPQQHGQEVVAADVIERYGVPIYEVDFGDEGKERYVLLSDFNTVVTELEQPQQRAEAVAVMYQQIHRHHHNAKWEECDKATFDQYTDYHQRYGGTPPVRALGVIDAESLRTPPPAIDIGKLRELRSLLLGIRPKFGQPGSRDVEVRAQQQRIDAAIALIGDGGERT